MFETKSRALNARHRSAMNIVQRRTATGSYSMPPTGSSTPKLLNCQVTLVVAGDHGERSSDLRKLNSKSEGDSPWDADFAIY
jgi:hypothetical protein